MAVFTVKFKKFLFNMSDKLFVYIPKNYGPDNVVTIPLIPMFIAADIIVSDENVLFKAAYKLPVPTSPVENFWATTAVADLTANAENVPAFASYKEFNMAGPKYCEPANAATIPTTVRTPFPTLSLLQ